MERGGVKRNGEKGLCWCEPVWSYTTLCCVKVPLGIVLSSVTSPWFFCTVLPTTASFSTLSLTLCVVTQAYGLFPHLSFELLTPQLRGVNGYC